VPQPSAALAEYKICVVGDPNSGRTSLIQAYRNEPLEVRPTESAVCFPLTAVRAARGIALFAIWDIATRPFLDPDYLTETREAEVACLEGADAAIIVFDQSVEDPFSHEQVADAYERVTLWYNFIVAHIGQHILVALAANKSERTPGQDLARLEEWAEQQNTLIFRTSVHEGGKCGIDQLFEFLADLLDRQTRAQLPPPPPPDFSWVPGSTVRFPFDSAIVGALRVHHITALDMFCTYTIEELRLLDYHIYRRITIPQLEPASQRQTAISTGWNISTQPQVKPEPVPWYAIPADSWPDFSDE
jgi:hypothetical protein